MGNANSFGSCASVGVALEKKLYRAGDTVCGYVQADVHQTMECTHIEVILCGEVRTKVKYNHTTGSGENRHTQRLTAKETEIIVQDRRIVAQFLQGQVQQGLYQFPFQFLLHPALPSSANVKFYDENAFLSYGVEVKMCRPGLCQADILNRTKFGLVANVPHMITPAFSRAHTQVNCCCCVNKGSMSLSAALTQNAFTSGQTVTVQMNVANNSSSPVQGVAVELKERIHFSARSHGETRERIIASATLPGLSPGGAFGESKGEPPQVVQLQLPPRFENYTLHTRLLQIQHWVEVRGDTGCCIDNPSVLLDVTLHRCKDAVVSEQLPADIMEDGEMAFVDPVTYQPNPTAMASPVSVQAQAGPAVVPQMAQALQMAPQQQVLQVAGRDVSQVPPGSTELPTMPAQAQVPLMTAG